MFVVCFVVGHLSVKYNYSICMTYIGTSITCNNLFIKQSLNEIINVSLNASKGGKPTYAKKNSFPFCSIAITFALILLPLNDISSI